MRTGSQLREVLRIIAITYDAKMSADADAEKAAARTRRNAEHNERLPRIDVDSDDSEIDGGDEPPEDPATMRRRRHHGRSRERGGGKAGGGGPGSSFGGASQEAPRTARPHRRTATAESCNTSTVAFSEPAPSRMPTAPESSRTASRRDRPGGDAVEPAAAVPMPTVLLTALRQLYGPASAIADRLEEVKVACHVDNHGTHPRIVLFCKIMRWGSERYEEWAPEQLKVPPPPRLSLLHVAPICHAALVPAYCL